MCHNVAEQLIQKHLFPENFNADCFVVLKLHGGIAPPRSVA